ncbi:hypothetical protein, partial [Nocardia abscessus]|uniref:hypothetical protein n=1 Tax=Nocardia abscessus TaxID=120957 RepID=UPI002458D478
MTTITPSSESVRRTDRPSRTRLDLLLAADSEPSGRDLAARESGCCSFFAFTFEATGAGLVMRVEVPHRQVGGRDALATRGVAPVGGDRGC